MPIFPNPAGSVVKVSEAGFADITLFDLHGTQMGQWQNVDRIDIAYLLPGLYVVEVRTGDAISTHRLLKQ
ncbi:MAG: T9SS type A sorting domain-containing protein, partial [Saprospiraceae bacterium]|nr:T9SS type A sorting domain-containing protein [Saprospiraceae bacterium]